MSSRICVKNLPRYLTEERLREHFSQVGEVTDAKIMRTQEGKSRQFGFIGYRTEKEAEAAVKYFKDTYLDTYKLICEVAYKIGDSNVPRPWSRYSQQKQENVKKDVKEDVKDRDSGSLKSSKKETLKQIQKTSTTDKDDPLLEEFLQVMQPRNKTKLWANDTILGPKNGYDHKPGHVDGQIGERKKKIDVEMVEGVLRKVPVGKGKSTEKLKRVHVRFDDESDEDTEGEDFLENENIIVDSVDEANKTPDISQSNNLAKDETVSDMEYFKSRVKHSWDDEDNSGEEHSAEEMDHESCEEGSSDEDEDNGGSINEELFIDVPDSKHPQDQCVPGVQLKDLKTDNNNISSELKVTDTNQNMDGNEIDQNGASSAEGPDESESAVETGRLFIRNLPFTTSEDDLFELFSKYGEISQVHLVLDRLTKQSKGYAYVLYMLPESALRALENLDKSIFQGRLLHVMPARKPPPAPEKTLTHGTEARGTNTFKQQREEQRKLSEASGDTRAWNSLFMHPDTIAENVARKYGVSKSELLNPEADDLAVRMALGETHIIAETKKVLSDEGVNVDILEGLALGKLDKVKRSSHILIIKNLPFSTSELDLVTMFGRFGSLERVILPPTKTLALAVYLEAAEARAAFKGLAYKRYKHVPLYLEWAPENILSSKPRTSSELQKAPAVGVSEDKKTNVEQQRIGIPNEDIEFDGEEVSRSIFVKNLNFKTTTVALQNHFEQHLKEGELRKVTMKGDPPKKENMGFCFIEFDTAETARNVCKLLQGTVLDGHALSLQISHHKKEAKTMQQKNLDKNKSSTKIIVRNVAFEATKKDLRQLFSPFGQIKNLRLPKKVDGSHRGFAFIEFITKQEAENAFNALSSSHLYGRHLVLEQAREDESLSELRARVASQFVDDNDIANSGRSSKRRKGIE
ncbi:uncharacterized protein LOC131078359 [Cryptomeria japonica]|uniref:uncharacterized protein LOC131078359 n=1 Tax=Cryptomeria japonica TaxID=3369 RepID=UPI0027DA96DD|nr:uncharacterized protein LOC131078359 [Cryptomeria japonica]